MREIKTVRETINNDININDRVFAGFNPEYIPFDEVRVYAPRYGQQKEVIVKESYRHLKRLEFAKLIDDLSDCECLGARYEDSIYLGRVLHIVIKDNSREKRQIRLKKQLKKMFRKIV